MKMKLKALCYVLLAAALALCVTTEGAAANKYEAEMSRWIRSQERSDRMGGRFIVRATLYTADYVNSLMESEAEKNLWTASELEDFKYNFFNSVKIDDCLPILVELEELGPTAHMMPFDEMIHLWVGNKKYAPADYAPRFNLPLQGKRDGLVYFPRYDEKTGEPIFNKNTTLRLVIVAGASPVLNASDVRLEWDVKPENIGVNTTGAAADRIEIDRLLRRMERLTGERTELETQLENKKREIDDINASIDDIRRN